MNYAEWLTTVPRELTGDALWRMEVYRLSLFAAELGWHDTTRLMQDHRTRSLADQLYSAVGSVGANLSEGYSRSSHKDQARFYEYSLGSARESRTWYFDARHLLGDAVVSHRLRLLTHIICHLLRIIPAERGYAMHEASPPYAPVLSEADLPDLLQNIPFA